MILIYGFGKFVSYKGCPYVFPVVRFWDLETSFALASYTLASPVPAGEWRIDLVSSGLMLSLYDMHALCPWTLAGCVQEIGNLSKQPVSQFHTISLLSCSLFPRNITRIFCSIMLPLSEDSNQSSVWGWWIGHHFRRNNSNFPLPLTLLQWRTRERQLLPHDCRLFRMKTLPPWQEKLLFGDFFKLWNSRTTNQDSFEYDYEEFST